MTVRFSKPPVHEVVIGAYFDPPLHTLRNEHIGILWSRLRDEGFPVVQQHPPLDGQTMGAGEFIMPRFWFMSSDEVTLIQVQKNALLFNWRKGEAEYPGFAAGLKPSFDEYYKILEAFASEELGEREIKIRACELTYIGMIQPCEYWKGPKDTGNLIPSFVTPDWSGRGKGTIAFNCNYSFEPAPGVKLNVSLRAGETADTNSSPILSLEHKAFGNVGCIPKSKAEYWYEQAHEAITECFLGMTSSEIQRKYWV